MMGMMKKNFEAIAFNMGQLAWVTTFFSGMVLGTLRFFSDTLATSLIIRVVKFPFSMMERHRVMTQRGIELLGLDGHYVSSLCWYILNTLGLRGITALLIGEASGMKSALDVSSILLIGLKLVEENDAQLMMQAQMMGAGQSMNTDTGLSFQVLLSFSVI